MHYKNLTGKHTLILEIRKYFVNIAAKYCNVIRTSTTATIQAPTQHKQKSDYLSTVFWHCVKYDNYFESLYDIAKLRYSNSEKKKKKSFQNQK